MGRQILSRSVKDLDLRLHLLGYRFDNKVGIARGFFDRTGVLQPPEGRIGVRRGHLAEFHRFVEIGANFSLCLAQSPRQQVFEDGAIPAERRSMRNASPHDAGADNRNRLNLFHLDFTQ